jgi:DNA helicase-2/ATP-dependent DNA helicase PcrA
MPNQVAPNSLAAAIIAEELALWARIAAFFARNNARSRQGAVQHDAELIELRDAIAEAKPEDLAPLVEQMARVSAVAAGRRGKTAIPVDTQAPYFAHVRLRPGASGAESEKSAGRPPVRSRDVFIGRHSFIDRAADIQIVDWRDAPVSQIYYRYDEGDDYDEDVGGGHLQGVIEVRRNLTIQDGRLRRIGCPQGTFFCDSQDVWWHADEAAAPALEGGHGLAARAPRVVAKPGRPTVALAGRVDKHLPEIAALIDRNQFDLIAEPHSGVVVIQGGAGSGKTTVALHRVAYLAHQAPERFRGSKVMIVVPTEALARYVSGVLPALGVSSIPVVTCANWLRHHKKRLLPHLPQQVTAETPPLVARLKKHPRMLHALNQYVSAQAVEMRTQIAEALSAHPGEQRDLLQIWDQAGQRPLRARCRVVRAQIPKILPSPLAVRMEDLLRRLTRRAQDIGRDWAELLTDAERLWKSLGEAAPSGTPAVTRTQIAELVAYCKDQQDEVEPLPDDVDPERYQAVDGQPLDEDGPAGRMDREDHALLLRLFQLKYGGLPHQSGKGFVHYQHLVLDEVQDLSAIEVKTLLDCVGEEGQEPSVTMAGDVVQRLIFDNSFTSWEDLLSAVDLPGARVQRLHILYRSTVEVMQLAHAVLGPLIGQASLIEQQAVRHGAPVQAFVFGEIGEAVAFLGEALRSLLGREPTASVALIARHAGTADAYYRGLIRSDVPSLRRVEYQDFSFAPGVDVTDVLQVKGLEFDYVVILDATDLAYPESTESRHLLHIAMTRAAHQLWLIATSTPSALIPTNYFPSAEAVGGAIID